MELSLPDLPYGSLMGVLYAEAAAAFEELTLSDRDDQLVAVAVANLGNHDPGPHVHHALGLLAGAEATVELTEQECDTDTDRGADQAAEESATGP